MWLIGKVNKMQRQHLEKMGNEVRTIDDYEAERVVGAVVECQENEEMIVVYIDGSMVDDLKALTKLKEDSKASEKRQEIHQERLDILAERWEIKRGEIRDEDYDIIGSEDWTCDGDNYSMPFDYCHNDNEEITLYGDGFVTFHPDSIKIKVEEWHIDD